jgi:hypothetical protein
VPPRCCDIPSRLFDKQGEEMCRPDGGRTGRGDGRCRDFFTERQDEHVVWKDEALTEMMKPVQANVLVFVYTSSTDERDRSC